MKYLIRGIELLFIAAWQIIVHIILVLLYVTCNTIAVLWDFNKKHCFSFSELKNKAKWALHPSRDQVFAGVLFNLFFFCFITAITNDFMGEVGVVAWIGAFMSGIVLWFHLMIMKGK